MLTRLAKETASSAPIYTHCLVLFFVTVALRLSQKLLAQTH